MARTNVAKLQINKPKSKIAKLTARSIGEQAKGNRYILQSEAKARRQAAGYSGWLGRSGKFDYSLGDVQEGENLLRGVAGMADAIRDQLTDEQYYKIMSMEGEKLSALYQNNKMVFEVYYNYGGISKDSSGANVVDASKGKEAQFLIDQYEKFFGTIE